MNIFAKIASGLRKTKEALANKLKYIFTVNEIDDEFYEDLENALLSSDVGIDATESIIDNLKSEVKLKKLKKAIETKKCLKNILIDKLNENEVEEFSYPLVIMVVGVNGVGKTTTIGKIANKFVKAKKNVLIAAADTFRAAASDQLSVWAERSKVRIVKSDEGSDPGSVVFDAIKSAKAKKADVLIIDTAGRLHNKVNLMQELNKLNRIVEKEYPEAKFLKMIVVDSTLGQNSLSQVEAFLNTIGLNEVVITKLDGTAKGGVLFALANNFKLGVRYVGVGEQIDDLIEFNAIDFVNSIIE